MIPSERQAMYRYLMALTVASAVGLQSWRTLFDNFAVNAAGLDGPHIGVVQSIREIPGFLTFLAVYLLLYIREHRLAAFSILLLGAGVAATGLFPSYGGVIGTTLLMSIGFHYFETANQSLTLQYFDARTSPWVFGKLRSVAAAANIGAGFAIYAMALSMTYSQMYLVSGGAVTAIGIWAFTRNPRDANLAPQRKCMVFRKRYGLFYFLTLMAGARRQIFVAFAVFLMVKKFGFTVGEVTLLFILNNTVNYFLSPTIGKAIIRFGERRVLSLEYFSLVFVFLAYAFVESRIIIAFLYILDHIFFNFAIAIRTYFQKLGDPRDMAPSMAVSFAINHIAAVCFPVVGGMLWMLDYRIPFMAGAVFSLISLLAVQKIRVPDGKTPVSFSSSAQPVRR